MIPIIVFFAFSMHYFQRESRADLLSSLAERWNGRVDRGAFLSNPRLEFRVDGVDGEVILQTGSQKQQSWTRVRFNWPSPNRLRVVPEGFSTWLRQTFGASDVRLGDLGFDEDFWIEASDPGWAREVLTPDLRRKLRNFRNSGTWLSHTNISLDVGRAGVALSLGRVLDTRIGLESFIELAITALRAARGGGQVTGVELAAVVVKGGSECPVCGHAVEGGKKCASCGTPHHEDCWKYAGGCAIFACGGRGSAAA